MLPSESEPLCRVPTDKHLLRCNGRKGLKIPYRFLGADDCAGPNYTRQPAVLSYYESL